MLGVCERTTPAKQAWKPMKNLIRATIRPKGKYNSRDKNCQLDLGNLKTEA